MALLEHMQQLGFRVRVSDEGDFWEGTRLAVLAKNIGEYDAMLAGMAGLLKDAAEASGQRVSSHPCWAERISSILKPALSSSTAWPGILNKLREAIVPQPDPPE